MYPTLLETSLFGVELRLQAYSTMLFVGAVIGLGLSLALAHRRGLPWPRVGVFLLAAVLSVPVGARLLHFATNQAMYADEPSRLTRVHAADFALFGGLLLAALVGLLVARVLRLPLWRVADAAAPGMLVGIVIARIGCLLNGCCFGVPAEGPATLVYPFGSQAHLLHVSREMAHVFGESLPVHATQVIEILGALAALVAVALLLSLRAPDGTPFLAAVALFSAVRWANWPLRERPLTLEVAEWSYPALYATIIALCLVLAVLRRSRRGVVRCAPR